MQISDNTRFEAMGWKEDFQSPWLMAGEVVAMGLWR